MKLLKYTLFALVVGLSVVGIISIYLHFNPLKSHTDVSSNVMLERIKKVVKLTTVEGNFSEIYNYKNHVIADVWGLRKKALIRVTATVAVGYDFENIKFTLDEATKTITISEMPYPQILSIDHDVDYYNIENGLFNMISIDDITKMGIQAKEFIAEKAAGSDLFLQAEEQREELFEILALAMQSSGWSLDYHKGSFKG